MTQICRKNIEKSLLYTASQSNSSKSNTGQSTTADTGMSIESHFFEYKKFK